MKKNKTKEEIMKRIISGKVKMRPRWQFLAEVYGIKSLTALMLLGSSIVLSVMIYLVEIESPLELFGYGEIGRKVFLQNFPYFLLLASLVLGIGGTILYSKTGNHYKKTTKKILIWMTIILISIAIFLTAARIIFNVEYFFG